MARKLKTYQTSLGFYDLAIAAPSMKAALEAWGAGSNLFHQGVAKESGDPEVVAATVSKPGVVLRRPVGSDGPFREHADLPTDLAGDGPKHGPKKSLAKPKEQVPRTTDDTRKAALAFEREQRRRENQRRKEEVATERQRQRHTQAIAKAQAALEKSEREHHRKVATIEAARDAIDKKSQAEDARWAKEKDKLEGVLRRAKE
jgi:colicin import membrane protein